MVGPRPTSGWRIGRSHSVVNWIRCLAKDFMPTANYDLGSSALGRDYVVSTVVHRRFSRQSLPTSDVSSTVRTVLESYADLLDSGLLSDDGPSHVGGPKSCHGLCGSGRASEL